MSAPSPRVGPETAGELLLAARGLLFDCDGVLVDSDASVQRAWSAWAHRYRLSPDLVAESVHGRRSADTVAHLIAPDGRAEALAAIDALEIDDARTVVAVPGARELLGSLPTGCWAVVTSGTRALATARLRAAGLPVPPILVTADDVAQGKPHPEGFLAASAALGLAPRQTLVLEDSVGGVRAARAAGVGAVLGVQPRAVDAGADVVVADLRPVRWSGEGLFIDAGAVLAGHG